jgi:hypothetical protein
MKENERFSKLRIHQQINTLKEESRCLVDELNNVK